MNYKLKIFIVLLLIHFLGGNNTLHAQFLKNILNSVKQTGQNNTTNKVDQATNKALDKVGSLGKKKSKKTTPSSNSNNTTAVADTTKPAGNNSQAQGTTAVGNNTSNAQPQNNPYNSDGSFMILNLSSDRIIAGGAVRITGSSIKSQNFNSVIITITT